MENHKKESSVSRSARRLPMAALNLILALAMSMSLAVMPTEVLAVQVIDSGRCGEASSWTIDSNGIMRISGTGKADFTSHPNYNTNYNEIVVGEGITSLRVNMTFNIEKLTIPSTLVEIRGPFNESMRALREIVCPADSSLERVGAGLFEGSPWLAEQRTANPLVIVGRCVVDGQGCEGAVVIPEGIISIGDEAFREAPITSISLPSTLLRIDNYAFSECSALESVTYSEATDPDYVARNAFAGAGWVQTLYKEGFPVVIGTYYVSPTAIGEAVIPEGVKKIGYEAFVGAELTSVTFPDSLEEIGANAFSNHKKLKSIALPDGLKKIGQFAFSGCTELSEIECSDGFCPEYIDRDAFSNTKWEEQYGSADAQILGRYLYNGYNVSGKYIVPGNVKVIGEEAFSGSRVREIVLQEGVERIGGKAFYNTKDIIELALPASVTALDEGALDFGVPGLAGDGAFKTITVDDGNPAFSSREGFLCDKEGTSVAEGVYNPLTEYIAKLYQNFLGRTPDMGGLSAWAKAVNSKEISGQELVLNFLFSQEFLSNPLDDAGFVAAMYRTIFNREPDEAGFNAWMSVLDRGCTRVKVLVGFLNSNEMDNLCVKLDMLSELFISDDILDVYSQVTFFVSRMYQYCLGRKYDEEGLRNWVTALVEGNATGAKVANGFFFSREMINQNLSNEDYVRVAYRTILDREPDEGGFAAWVQALDGGSERETIVKGFVQSVEFGKLCASYGIAAF